VCSENVLIGARIPLESSLDIESEDEKQKEEKK